MIRRHKCALIGICIGMGPVLLLRLSGVLGLDLGHVGNQVGWFLLLPGLILVAPLSLPLNLGRSEMALAAWIISTLVYAGIGACIDVMLNARRAESHAAGATPCAKCGYDLTGNVSGTCPECGTRIG